MYKRQVIECGEEILLADGKIDPMQSGIPSFGCHPITTEIEGLCDIIYTYEDIELPTCGNSYKIQRTWTILNSCTSESINFEQLIKVEDSKGPIINVENITANTSDDSCDTNLFFNEAVIDNCSAVTSLKVRYQTGGSVYIGTATYDIVDVLNGEQITGLSLGETAITITAIDECSNITEETITITIEAVSYTHLTLPTTS